MAGYIYCMKNSHPTLSRFVKIGFTERSPELRRRELCKEYNCDFELLWDFDVYEAGKAEKFIHAVFSSYRHRDWEFFRVDPERAREFVEKLLDDSWREIEGKGDLPPDLVDLVKDDRQGILLEGIIAYDDDDAEGGDEGLEDFDGFQVTPGPETDERG